MPAYRDFSNTLLCGLALLTGLSLYAPGSLSLAPYEAMVLKRASQPLELQLQSVYSPLYLLLMGIWQQAATNPLWLRVPGLLCGLLALILGIRVIRQLVGFHAAPAALVLLAGAPFLVAQARAISPATMALALAMMSYSSFLEYRRAGERVWLGAWIAISIISWGVQASLIFLSLVQSAVMLINSGRFNSEKQRWWWVAQIGVLILFALAFWHPLSHFVTVRLPALTPAQTAEAIPMVALLSTNLPLPEALPGMLVMLVLGISGLRAAADWRKNPRHSLLIFGLIAPCPVYLFTPQSEVILLCALPCLFGLVAMGLRLYPRWARQGFWAAIALCYIWSYWHLH